MAATTLHVLGHIFTIIRTFQPHTLGINCSWLLVSKG